MGSGLIKKSKRGANAKRLSTNAQVFVAELLNDNLFNPTAAAKRAGYAAPSVAANKLMKDKRIQAILGKALRDRLERLEMNGDTLLRELAYCALRDPIDLCNENGQIDVDDLRKIPERIRRCIDSIKIKESTDDKGNVERTIELKLTSKLAAIEIAMKHHGMFAPEQHQVTMTSINWDDLCKEGKVEDVIEAETLAIEEKKK